MKILFLFLFLSSSSTHDIQVAFFKVHQKDEMLTMEVVFEKDDINSTFNQSGIDLTDRTLHNYIHDNLSLSINNEAQSLTYRSILVEDNHIYVKSNDFLFNEKIKSVMLKNTCLLNIADHSNIIELRIENQERDFLMNSNRTTIDIKY